eukprot:CAMPEP_0117430708 /NCGR_PEP_ID=MMETSP0758-20121206/10261_1 /TAXON_ID=63605 /ORGANISM="Percolomonas cosmopolitus, Strain AE-1 (ATCC 50343)" /LENGTH=85 /DNA_ID=CAMNT_0005219025 /DNA_START=1267 /DNA_END=1521 /DNA_ORIENTATION=-
MMSPPSLEPSKLWLIRVLYAGAANLLLATANLIGFQLSSKTMEFWELIMSSKKGIFDITILYLTLSSVGFVVMSYYHYKVALKQK